MQTLVERRMDAIKNEIMQAWKALDCCYQLTIEPEVFWRRGRPRRSSASQSAVNAEQVNGMFKHSYLSLLCGSPAARSARGAAAVEESPLGEAVERQLPSDEAVTQWTHDPQRAQDRGGRHGWKRGRSRPSRSRPSSCRTSSRRSASSRASPTFRRATSSRCARCSMACAIGATCACISSAMRTISRCPMRSRGVYGDNAGLSRERAGEVAEFLQTRLNLPPEAISYEWAGDTQPIATNATAEGRALNRRVEVEVWYDETKERARRAGSARQGGLQARQGLPHGDGLQDALQGRSLRGARA